MDFDSKTKVLKSIFWSHASQRVEYKDFGDVITFDTTHKTNNNLKNVSFGQALLRDETTESFKWLFETFKNCMGAPALCDPDRYNFYSNCAYNVFLVCKLDN